MSEIKNMNSFEKAVSEFEVKLRELELYRLSSDLSKNPRFHWYEYKIIFKGKATNRLLEIHCAPEIPNCSLTIQNTSTQIGDRDYILLYEYLHAHKSDELDKLRDFKRQHRENIDALDYFRGFFAIATKYLEGDLNDLIQGHRWENVSIDRSLLDY
jgi:hypothetical protein